MVPFLAHTMMPGNAHPWATYHLLGWEPINDPAAPKNSNHSWPSPLQLGLNPGSFCSKVFSPWARLNGTMYELIEDMVL